MKSWGQICGIVGCAVSAFAYDAGSVQRTILQAAIFIIVGCGGSRQ